MRLLVEQSHNERVQLYNANGNKYVLSAAVLEVSHPNLWDYSILAFLPDDQESGTRWIKFSGIRLHTYYLGVKSNLGWRNLFLSCGPLILNDPITTLDRKTMWVRLCWSTDWEGPTALEHKFRGTSNLDLRASDETDVIQHASDMLRATVVRIGTPSAGYFGIELNSE